MPYLAAIIGLASHPGKVVGDDRPGRLFFGDELGKRLEVFVDADGDHFKAVVEVLLVVVEDVRHFLAAWAAPGGPKVHEHHFALVAREVERLGRRSSCRRTGTACRRGLRADRRLLSCGDFGFEVDRLLAVGVHRAHREDPPLVIFLAEVKLGLVRLSAGFHLDGNLGDFAVDLRPADADRALAFFGCRQHVERRLAALEEFLGLGRERFAGDFAFFAPQFVEELFGDRGDDSLPLAAAAAAFLVGAVSPSTKS